MTTTDINTCDVPIVTNDGVYGSVRFYYEITYTQITPDKVFNDISEIMITAARESAKQLNAMDYYTSEFINRKSIDEFDSSLNNKVTNKINMEYPDIKFRMITCGILKLHYENTLR